MSKLILLNVDELWLKGKNRTTYIKILYDQIYRVCRELHIDSFQLKNENQRFILTSQKDFQSDLLKVISDIPGLFSLQPARICQAAVEAIKEEAVEVFAAVGQNNLNSKTFRVKTKRSFKQFALTSMELDKVVGGKILSNFKDWKVDLHNPGVEIQIKVVGPKTTYITGQKILGIGGLPVGSSGKLITLLSGGFDSPVASYLMSARGCRQTFAFFHAYPFVGDEVKEKIVNLCKVLSRYQVGCRLHIIPFGKIQDLIAKNCREAYRTVLFRYAMILGANLLAETKGYDALCTGDSLAQVSSQTIGNINLLDSVSERPILRPLIGFSKRNIMELAQKIGTHDLSLVPHDDACSLFSPQRPITCPRRGYWQSVTRELREELGITDFLKDSLNHSECYSIHFLGRAELLDN